VVGGRWLPHTKEVANSGSPRVKEVADGGGSLERRRCSTADLPGRARWPAVDPSGRRRLPAGDAPPPRRLRRAADGRGVERLVGEERARHSAEGGRPAGEEGEGARRG
jgi:hypothetical protein